MCQSQTPIKLLSQLIKQKYYKWITENIKLRMNTDESEHRWKKVIWTTSGEDTHGNRQDAFTVSTLT